MSGGRLCVVRLRQQVREAMDQCREHPSNREMPLECGTAASFIGRSLLATFREHEAARGGGSSPASSMSWQLGQSRGVGF